MKDRLTITLDEELLLQIDKLIDGSNIKNRSHAINVLIKKSLGGGMPRQAVILCGGKGTRLRPITYEIPKVLLPIKGKSIIEYLFDLFKKHKITNIILCVGYLKKKVIDHCGDGSRFGLSIKYVEDEIPLGTAGALKKAQNLIKETCFVTNGDELKDLDLEEMYNTHQSTKALATIALTTVHEPKGYGIVSLSGNKIQSFSEKPKHASSLLINSGMYIIEPSVLDYIPPGFCSLEKEVFPRIAREKKLSGYPFSGQWVDTGTIEKYEMALKEWKGVQ